MTGPSAGPAPLEFLAVWFAWGLAVVMTITVIRLVWALIRERITTEWLP